MFMHIWKDYTVFHLYHRNLYKTGIQLCMKFYPSVVFVWFNLVQPTPIGADFYKYGQTGLLVLIPLGHFMQFEAIVKDENHLHEHKFEKDLIFSCQLAFSPSRIS